MARAVRRAAVRLAAETVARERLQTDLAASRADLLSSVEGTQARIGRELHDGVGSHLTGLSFFARGLVRRIERGEPVAASEMEDAAAMVDDVLEQVRRLSRGLTPSEMEPGGLVSALADLAAAASHASGLRVTSTRLDEPRGLSAEQEMHVFRIAQEAVANALKHAQASGVAVSLRNDPGAVVLTVRDDGIGFSESLRTHAGVGLRTMQHRAVLAGGRMDVGDGEGRGTVVRVTVATGL